MQLFALVSNSPDVHRISLSQALGPTVGAVFVTQAKTFLHEVTGLEFDAGHTAEADEFLFIDPFAPATDLFQAAAHPIACPVFDVSETTLPLLKGLFVVAIIGQKLTACLQTFDMRRALTPGRLSFMKVGEGYQRLEGAGITLDTHIASLAQDGRLLFKSFPVASRLFDLTSYYHEATAEEVDEFGSHKSFITTDTVAFKKTAESSRLRKQIALVLGSKVLETFSVGEIVRSAKNGAPHLKIQVKDRGKKARIVMPGDRKELKDLLDLLLENYYRGGLSKTQFVANSKRKVK